MCSGDYGCGARRTYRFESGELVRVYGQSTAKLTSEQARAAILSPLSAFRLAQEFNVSAATIKDVRNGRVYAAVTADLRGVSVKRKQEYCTECIHYLHKKCSLGFPESRSPSYAANCAVFSRSWSDPAERAWDPDILHHINSNEPTKALSRH